ncbi:hypothetical protein BDZ89DRAFT_1040256 [Hymenopellis radicata]|nr:hypothetical protein BDZ89DRAFT_1040256 [Hymenopellis radicata]
MNTICSGCNEDDSTKKRHKGRQIYHIKHTPYDKTSSGRQIENRHATGNTASWKINLSKEHMLEILDAAIVKGNTLRIHCNVSKDNSANAIQMLQARVEQMAQILTAMTVKTSKDDFAPFIKKLQDKMNKSESASSYQEAPPLKTGEELEMEMQKLTEEKEKERYSEHDVKYDWS